MMKVNNKSVEEIAEVLKNIRSAAIFCHIRPDGDALGSGFALCTALKNAGKNAIMVCEDAVPEKLAYLPNIKGLNHKLPNQISSYDTLISVDCADISRLGQFSGVYARFQGTTVNIDHHISNNGYGKYNYVHECPATCELMPEILDATGFDITEDIANLIMAGLLTDSGNFSHGDVSAKTFAVASYLKEKGADVTRHNYLLFKRQTKTRALLFAKAISKIRYFSEDRIAVLTITQEDMKAVGADSSITEGMVDFALSVDSVEISISVMEVKRGQYKVSLRSKGKADVNAVASKFGGGGHILASGCMLFGEYEEVVERLVFASDLQI